jgi:hypothetical protein
MLRLSNNRFVRKHGLVLNGYDFLPVLLCAIISTSCGFADLRPIGISVEPSETDSLLPDPYSPVILKFDTEMEKNDAEGIMQIISDSGVIKGDLSWKNNDLYFVPIAGWTAGIRYTLSLSGTIRSVDGRELRLERFVSFYAVNKSEPPLLERFSPDDGASVGTGGCVLELHFSCPMDRLSVELALVFEGISNKTFEWSANDKSLKVIPDKALSAWTAYRWNLKDSAKSGDGVPLPKSYSAQFTTDLDKIPPQVERVFPVLNSGGIWFPTGADIETGLGAGDAIAVEFNKSMGENAIRSMRFDPSLSGRTEFLSEKSIVYIFSRNPEPEAAYTLIISGDTRDSEGLKLGADYRINFIPDIPFLNVLQFNAGDDSVISNFSSSTNVLPVRVNSAVRELSFSIRFSLPFGNEEKQNTALKIFLSPFFPAMLSPVALRNVYWISDDRLSMNWEGLEAGKSGEPHYYKLTIPGGKSGIVSKDGMYMKEDIIILLEAVN